MNSIQKLELYANKLNATKLLVKGYGHFSPKDRIIQINELNKIIEE